MPAAPLTLVESLGQAHAALRQGLQELDEACRSPGGRTPAEMSTALARVRGILTEHFGFEEQNGYMDGVLKRAPHLDRTVRGLQAEHRELLQSLDALREEARTGQCRDQACREKVRAWLQAVRSHESRENVLVEDAFNVDLGIED